MISVANIDDRITKCQKILDTDPSSQIFAALADAYRKKGELDQAFKVCQTGLKIHPKYGAAHIVMAKINLDRGLYDWAEIEAKKAAETDGRSRAVELLLAEVYIYKGEFTQAIKLLKKLHDADPGSAQIKRLLDIAQRLPEEQKQQMEARKEKPKVIYGQANVESFDESQTAAPTTTDEPQKYSAKQVLLSAITIPGIDGALFINREGLVVESEWTVQLDASTCGAVIGEVAKQVEQELMANSFGEVQTVLIESQSDQIFYVTKVHNGSFLYVANSAANLGSVRMKIDKLLERY